MINKIHNLDCLDLLYKLDTNSIDAIITDPPYYGVVSDDWDNQWESMYEYLDWCAEWIKESKRVLKRSGSFFIFGWSYQLSKLISTFEDNGYTFRQNITIWKGMRSAAGRTSSKLKMFPTTTEYLHYYHVDSKDYIRNLLQDKKASLGLSSHEINEYLGVATNGGGVWSSIAGPKKKDIQEPTREIWEKLDKLFGGLPNYDDLVYMFNLPQGVTDVFDDIDFYSSAYKKTRVHPTQKPLDLMDRLVNACTKEGDVVLDLFGGSGATAISCIRNKRNFILGELDKDYLKVSREWVKKEKNNLKLF